MKTLTKPGGVIAAGHPETVRAAAIILEEGGNAFDAVLAAVYASCVAEPVLASLGGGGFLLARPTEEDKGNPLLYDFFTQTPKNKISAGELDFHPIIADFGPATQEFHIGMGSIATPGMVKGLFQIHRDLCTMPMARITEPAVSLARDGFLVNRLQAYMFQIVGPIFMATPASRKIFASRQEPDDPMGEGETMSNPDFAAVLEALADEGEALFYEGDIARAISDDCRNHGGQLTRQDFQGYRIKKRKPLTVDYRGARLYTNPPPSSGGILIGFALELMKEVDLKPFGFGSADHLQHLAKIMGLTNKARVESGFYDAPDEKAARNLLDANFIAAYKAEVLGRPECLKGTTHISVIDAAGNAAAMTLSNGEGAGYIAPGTGIMLNNMLGEEDINTQGFHQWPADTRPCSMMAPSVVIDGAGRMVALGSGGSNRIRTAILQVLVNLLDYSMSVEEAVAAPRMHFENGLLNIERGFDEGTVGAFGAAFQEIKQWDEKNLFFGGVHAVSFNAQTSEFTGAGDPRRGGDAVVV